MLKRSFRFTPDAIRRARYQKEFDRLNRKPPELIWETCPSCPQRRTEPSAVKVGRYFCVVGGYESIENVLKNIDVLDLKKLKWIDRIELPPNVPQTHTGVASAENRFVYLAGGQVGPQCRPAVADCFAFDFSTRSWSNLPPLPEARYSATVQFWRGRLHVMSGAKPDRWTSAHDYWSIAVKGGRALDKQWRPEAPLPTGGPHRASAILDDKLYVFGGQDGDVKPIACDPAYTCNWDTPLETLNGSCFMLREDAAGWTKVSSLCVPCTHCESAAVAGDKALLAGGNEGRRRVSDLIQLYDSRNDRWRIVGKLPYPMKTVAVYDEGWLYVVAGQRSITRDDLRPGRVVDTVWRARVDFK